MSSKVLLIVCIVISVTFSNGLQAVKENGLVRQKRSLSDEAGNKFDEAS